MTFRYLSVCSGIEAASVAWEPLGAVPVAFSEIEAFPAAVLAHHWPGVPNLGDFTKIDTRGLGRVDVLVGGTPCQAFSIAGARHGLADARGNLSLAFVRLMHELASGNGLRAAIWENVPGVLSMSDNAFGCFLGGLVGADDSLRSPLDGGRWPDCGMVAGPRARVAWRVLDAQHFRLAQRRRRVFVVVGIGTGGIDPAAVLFERKSSGWDSSSRQKPGEGVAGTLSARTSAGGGLGTDFDLAGGLQVTHTLRATGFDASEDGTGRGTPLVPCRAFGGNNTSGPIDVAAARIERGGAGRMDFETETFVAFDCKAGGNTGFSVGDVPGTLRGNGHGGGHAAVAVSLRGREGGATAELSGSLMPSLRTGGGGGDKAHVLTQSAVRRLTPRECERLMGFPDDYTAITYRGKPAADGPRYKAIGNSMAVPVMRWIGERLAFCL